MQQESYKYWAFISYSHRDQAWAEWLHKALETYRVPRRLVGRETAAGPVPRRLFPVFRDLEELPSSPNLSGAIDQALLQSRYLIVIASPYAAVSKWVDQEIARFRAMGRGDRILCLIVDGEPHADLQPGRGFLECFPPSLRTKDGIEPIAADVRPRRDGKPAARLKLIAGLLGVGLDELRRRERRRSMLQKSAWVVFVLFVAVILLGLWRLQQREQQEALSQQALHTHLDTVYEEGRKELLEHNEARAAVLLDEARRLGIDTPALRFMQARAMRIVDAEKIAFQSGSAVSHIRFSRDATRIVTQGAEDVARVWDVASGRKEFEFPLPSNTSAWGPAFSRDNKLIFFMSASDDSAIGSLQVWSADSGQLLATLRKTSGIDHAFNLFDQNGRRLVYVDTDHAAEIYDLASAHVFRRMAGDFSVAGFSRDGKRLMTGERNGEVAIWDGEGRRKVQVLHGLHAPIVSLDDTEDGVLVAAAAEDGTVRVWQAADGAVRLVAGHPSAKPFLLFNIDGTRLLTKAGDGARVWDTVKGSLVYVQQFAGASGNRVDISSNGRWVMTSSSSRLLMQDAESGVELFSLDAHRGMPRARDISDDDSLLATGGPDGRVVLWKTPSIPDFELRHSVDAKLWSSAPRPPGVAAIYNHAGNVIATGAGDGLLKLWDAKTHELIRSIEADPRSVNVVGFSIDDKRIATGGEAGGVRVWDVASGTALRTLACDGRRVLTVSFSLDGRVVAAALRGGISRLWDADTGEELASLKRDEARAAGFSPDGKFFAVGAGGVVKLWDIGQRKFVWSSQLSDFSGKRSTDVGALVFSSDGSRVWANDLYKTVFLIDSAGGRILQKIDEPAATQMTTMALNHHDDAAVIADQSGVALLVRPKLQSSWVLRGHAGEVRTAAFSPNDAFVLTSGVDATAKIWDSTNGELLDTVAEHSSPMPEQPFEAAGFSPDGRWALSGSVDGVIRLWELRDESRNSQQIESMLRCRVPWRLAGDGLTNSSPEDANCTRP